MCRYYKVIFESCGHPGDEHSEWLSCAKYSSCVQSNDVYHIEDGFCIECLWGDTSNMSLHRLNYIRLGHLQGLLNIAPSSRYRHFRDEVPGVYGYRYDSENIEQFTGRLDEDDGHWLAFLSRSISSHIIDPDLPKPTQPQCNLFQQIRVASVRFNILEKETRYTYVEGTINPVDRLPPAGTWLRMLKEFYKASAVKDIIRIPDQQLLLTRIDHAKETAHKLMQSIIYDVNMLGLNEF